MSVMNKNYVRSVIFGFEDSLVSTTGVVAGIAAGTREPRLIILAGIVTIVVEALSMGAGQFLSERAVHEIDKECDDDPRTGAVLMFFSYFFAGFIPLGPILFLDYPVSVYVSVGSALAGLFLLGYIKGKVVKVQPVRSGLEILIVGGTATLLGLVAGIILKI